MIASYHSHSRWCRHGKGELEEYVLEAIKKGLKTFAICDHYPDDIGFGKRMPWSEVEDYFKEVNRLKEKYGSKIELLTVLEAEYHELEVERLICLKEKYGINFYILGQHDSSDRTLNNYRLKDVREGLHKYTEDILKALDTGFFKVLAHPELLIVNTGEADSYLLECVDRIFKRCSELGVYVEVNANGFRNRKPYPCKEVWLLSKKYPDLKVIVSSDAHSPEELVDENVAKAEAFARELNLNTYDYIMDIS